MSELSTKPYLIRAIYEWCSDNGYRPYIAVVVDERTQVPFEFVRNGEIVLNVSAEATNHLVMGNDVIEFEARFNRVARQVSVPVANVTAIYAAENGHGMAFEVPKAPAVVEPKAEKSSRGALREVSDLPGAEAPAAAEEAPAAPIADSPVAVSPAPTRRRGTKAAKATDDAAPVVSLVPPAPAGEASDAGPTAPADATPDPAPVGEGPSDEPPPRKGGRPRLTRVK